MSLSVKNIIPILAAAISGSAFTFIYLKNIKIKARNDRSSSSSDDMHGISSMSPSSSVVIRPPFPSILRDMLSKCRLAYLSTVDMITTEANVMLSSHLCLMRFTYLKDDQHGDGDVIIMSTNRKTKKYDILLRHKQVALLVHDFYQFDEEKNSTIVQRSKQGDDGDNINMITSTCSITLNGECHILFDEDEKCRRYREAHLRNNPDYPQFIIGEDIAILYLAVTSARICNVHDQVMKWSVFDQ